MVRQSSAWVSVTGGVRRVARQVGAGAVLAVAVSGAWAGYETTVLSTLGGSTSRVNGINNAGQAVGGSRTAGDLAFHPTVWTGGMISDLGTLGGASGRAVGVNSVGQVVGGSNRPGNVGLHATLWNAATTVDLGDPTGAGSYANAINDAGQVAGRDGGRAVLWSGGVPTVLSGFETEAYDINVHGAAVGFSRPNGSTTRATLWEGGQVTLLSTLPGGTFGGAFGINGAGQVVGFSNGGSHGSHATLWSSGLVTDLGTLGGARSFAYDINNVGQVVGQAQAAGGSTFRATLWSGGVATDLNDFLSAEDRASGWVLSDENASSFSASFRTEIAINDNGWIVAGANNTITGQHRAYLLTPTAAVPEPASWALVLGGLALLSARLRQLATISG